MSFKLSAVSDTFLLPVKATIAGDKGKPQVVSFHVACKRLTEQEVKDLWTKLTPPKPDEERAQMTDRELVDEVVTGFGTDLLGEDDKPLEYSADAHTALFSIHPLASVVATTFFDYYMKAGLRTKN